MPEAAFDWYALVDAAAALEQGDLVDNFPVADLEQESVDYLNLHEGETTEGEFLLKRYDLIVMTQSCDLPDMKDDARVILCPRFSYKTVLKQRKSWRGSSFWEMVRKGQVMGTHLLNGCDIAGHEFHFQLVDLQEIFTIPFAVVKHVINAGHRTIRLQPPYREHLAQAFARQFMRVGLPKDIPSEYPFQQTAWPD
jgi:hypothetical protein